MPYLMAALVPYYGEATGEMTTLNMDEDDPLVETLRRGVRRVGLPEAENGGERTGDRG